MVPSLSNILVPVMHLQYQSEQNLDPTDLLNKLNCLIFNRDKEKQRWPWSIG